MGTVLAKKYFAEGEAGNITPQATELALQAMWKFLDSRDKSRLSKTSDQLTQLLMKISTERRKVPVPD